jgi:hypothetical protein
MLCYVMMSLSLLLVTAILCNLFMLSCLFTTAPGLALLEPGAILCFGAAIRVWVSGPSVPNTIENVAL